VLQRAGERRHEEVQQLGDADTGQRCDGEDRVEVPAGDGRLEIRDQVGDDELVPGQVAVHQGLVLALGDDPLDQLAAEPVGLRDLHMRLEQRHQAGHGAVGAALHEVQRMHALPQHHLAGPDGVVDVRAGLVQLGDDDRARHADRVALLPQLHGGRVDAVHGRDDEEGRISGPQSCSELPHEVGRAGGVQQCDAVPGVLDRRDPE
jgi:hypothetical protein